MNELLIEIEKLVVLARNHSENIRTTLSEANVEAANVFSSELAESRERIYKIMHECKRITHSMIDIEKFRSENE